MSSKGYDILIQKLDEFIRKYYKNRMVRGLIYSVGIILAGFLVIATLEHFGRFGTSVRTALFVILVGGTGFVLTKYVFIPLFKLFRLGKTISHAQASNIIGDHFGEIKDKLLNTLQLKQQADAQASAGGDYSLLESGIDQKIEDLRPVPFTAAIDMGANKKYLKYALIPLGVFAIMLFARPSMITDSTSRIVKFNTEIVPVAPFSINLVNDDLSVAQNEDFRMQVELVGEEIPEKVYLEIDGTQFKLNKDNKVEFFHEFRNVQKDVDFKFYADGFYFGNYTLKTLPAPMIINFGVALDYPAYIGLKDEQINNTGDMSIPQGTKVKWNFNTKNAEKLSISLMDSLIALAPSAENNYQYQLTAMRNMSYAMISENEFMKGKDSIRYQIRVVPDLHPLIAVEEKQDSVSNNHLYFTGEVKDDYGFRRLVFNYERILTDEDGTATTVKEREEINITKAALAQEFFYHWDLDKIGLNVGERLNYYFEIWDNDGINGSKSTRTQLKTFAAPTEEELEAKKEENNDTMKKDIEESIKDAKELQEELDKMRREMLEKEELDWQDKKKMEDLLKKQKELQDKVEKIQQKNEQNNFQENEFKPPNEEILKKQEQLQKLFDELMTPEMKEMYEELEKLMEEFNKEDLQEQLEDMNLTDEDIEKELDRALEQFKQMELDQKLEETAEKLEELAKEQEKLAEESKEKDADAEEIKEKQDKLNEEFEKLEEEFDKIEEMNEDLENKKDIPDTEEQQKEIEEEMKESSDKLEDGKKKKASESQDNAAEKMKQMAQDMKSAMAAESEESQSEDMEALRALLENIITLSFDQEELMANLKQVEKDDPKYVEYGQVQRKLKDDAKMVEDSLFALSKRVIQIASIVNREINAVNDNMEKALGDIGERRTSQATSRQQYVMTSFNNLALLLDEALKQMQQQMAQSQPGTGNCEKPGGNGKKPSASDMKKMQESLEKQLQQMKDQMGKEGEGEKNGEKPGGQPGSKPGMSKSMVQMAAKQAAIRKQIQQMSEELNKDGKGAGNGLKEIAKDMEEIEKDLVNKRLDTETLKRQQDIMIRLLESEKAEREREQDEKRQSNEAKNQQFSNPLDYLEYQIKKEQEVEFLKTLPPSLKPHYEEKVYDYFNKLDGE